MWIVKVIKYFRNLKIEFELKTVYSLIFDSIRKSSPGEPIGLICHCLHCRVLRSFAALTAAQEFATRHHLKSHFVKLASILIICKANLHTYNEI